MCSGGSGRDVVGGLGWGILLLIGLGGQREGRELPSGVEGKAPAENRFGCILFVIESFGERKIIQSHTKHTP